MLADQALDPDSTKPGLPTVKIAGPQEENIVDLAIELMATRGDPVQIQGAGDPSDADAALNESGALLPSTDVVVVGPTLQPRLDAGERVPG